MSTSADQALIRSLLRGDEAAFAALVDRLHPRLVRLSRRFVASDAAAEDAAQDTWQAVLQGLSGFAGRCALDTWILQIALNRARSRGVRDARARPLDELELEGRFSWLGVWKDPPRRWRIEASPETAAANRELVALLAEALDALPDQQRTVVVLRDVELLSAAEVCAVLELSEENQRVLLHRGRARLRSALELALADPVPAPVPA
jgi:RNA polymerase sigma-70 factor (ECF subfamily)